MNGTGYATVTHYIIVWRVCQPVFQNFTAKLHLKYECRFGWFQGLWNDFSGFVLSLQTHFLSEALDHSLFSSTKDI
jgi:hypothetical protein